METISSVTVNKAAVMDTYPLPKAEDLFVTLAGGVSFTKLDLSHVYQQIVLDKFWRNCQKAE